MFVQRKKQRDQEIRQKVEQANNAQAEKEQQIALKTSIKSQRVQ